MSYRLSMFIHLLKKSDWAFLLDFVSPAFFKVIPPLELVSNASALAKRTQDKELYRRAIIAMREQISKTVPEIQLLQGQMSHGHSDVLGFNRIQQRKSSDAHWHSELSRSILLRFFFTKQCFSICD